MGNTTEPIPQIQSAMAKPEPAKLPDQRKNNVMMLVLVKGYR